MSNMRTFVNSEGYDAVRLASGLDDDSELYYALATNGGFLTRSEVVSLRDFLTDVLMAPGRGGSLREPGLMSEWVTGINVDQINNSSTFVRNLNELEARSCRKLDLGDEPIGILQINHERREPTGIGVIRNSGGMLSLAFKTRRDTR